MTRDEILAAVKVRKSLYGAERLLVFLREIAAMGPADGEWPANTLDDAVAIAKRALNHEQKADEVKPKRGPEYGCDSAGWPDVVGERDRGSDKP